MKRPPAVAALIGAALVFALMALATKVACARLPGPQVAFVRFVIGLGACAIAGLRVRMRARNKVGLLLRGAYGGAAVLFYFIAIAHLPVGIATLLNYTAPVFTAIYAAVFLGEAITRGTLFALALTSVGVALVIVGTAPAGSLALGRWQLVGLLSALLSGAAVATIREVRKTDGSWEIFAAFCLAGAVICAGPALQGWVRPRPLEWKILVLVGVLSVIGQLLMTHALRYVRAAVGGIIAQLTPVTSIVLGWMMFRDRIAGLALAGAALTLAGVSVGAYLASGREADPVDE
ncbi:MAG TPA: DMT family transporter [Polyangia bacterium]|nr:DMT family transporter [Polyangia bacterium]